VGSLTNQAWMMIYGMNIEVLPGQWEFQEHGGGANALGIGSLIVHGSLMRKRTVITSREISAPSRSLCQ